MLLYTFTILALAFPLPFSGANKESIKVSKRIETLDDKGEVVLAWELDSYKKEIIFELFAATKGYVGFGISPNGGMSGADIFIAGVHPDGTPYSSDRFATGKSLPLYDTHSDWNLLNASETRDHTYLKFSRALDTCDQAGDYPITYGTNRVIWALGITDKENQHSASNRGTKSIDLLAPAAPTVDLSKMNWTYVTTHMLMPSEDTSYWCSFHRGPLLHGKHYITAFEPEQPTPRSRKHTHHFFLYSCTLPEDGSMDEIFDAGTIENGDNGELCYFANTAANPRGSVCQSLLYSWAKGGKKMVFPENLGFPIGKEGKTKQMYYKLELHYDNPERESNIHFETGVKIYYSSEPRTYDADQVRVYHSSTKVITVPPMTADFVVAGHCSDKCTAGKIPSAGIKVFNVLMHSHLSGRKLKLRHFRNGIELPWIANDDHYDFDFQQNMHLMQEIHVLPGDHLTYECTYDSTWYNGKVVTGGLSTTNEMCQSLLWYYPRIPGFTECGSRYDYEQNLRDFGITEYTELPTSTGLTYLITKPDYLEGEYDESLSFKFNWTDTFKRELESKRRYGDHVIRCVGNPNLIEGTVRYPPINYEYVPPKLCTSGSSIATLTISILLPVPYLYFQVLRILK